MEKSSEVILSAEERAAILGKAEGHTKKAAREEVPERFKGWYSLEELKEIAKK